MWHLAPQRSEEVASLECPPGSSAGLSNCPSGDRLVISYSGCSTPTSQTTFQVRHVLVYQTKLKLQRNVLLLTTVANIWYYSQNFEHVK